MNIRSEATERSLPQSSYGEGSGCGGCAGGDLCPNDPKLDETRRHKANYSNWSEEQLKLCTNVVLQAFGPQRLMFGSDSPVCLWAIQHERWVKLVEKSIDELSEGEQARIWAGTAMEAYGLA